MASKPRTPFTKQTMLGSTGSNRLGAKRPTVAKAEGGHSGKAPKSNSGVVTIIIVALAAIIGIFYFLHQNKEERLQEIANAEARNRKTHEENKLRAEEHQRKLAKDKEEKRERRKALEARQTEEAAKQTEAVAPERPNQDEPADTDETPATNGEDATPDTETPADTQETDGEDTTGGTPDDDEAPGTPADEMEVGELELSPKADKSPVYAKRLSAWAARAAKSGEYQEFANALKEKLSEAYPREMNEETGKLTETIRQGKLGEKARCLYTSLSLALASGGDADEELQKAFVSWLLTNKNAPAVAFGQALARYQVSSRAEATEKMQTFRLAYKESPAGAFSKIKSIVDPVESFSKKLYPYSKKELEATIAKLKDTKAKGRVSQDQQDAVNLVNIYRLVSGVAPNVVHDQGYEKQAMDAASICKAKGDISHNFGHSTDKCNLYPGVSGPPSATVTGYMNDPGGPNRKQKGHRRWILNPALGKTGFGKADGYQAMHVFDSSASARPKNAWSYPGRGFFPVRYLHSNGWSYYGQVPGSKVKVEMWKLPEGSLKRPPSSSQLTKETAVPVPEIFLNAGVSVIFEPDYSKMEKKDGKLSGAYWIRISWPGHKDEYVVDFY